MLVRRRRGKDPPAHEGTATFVELASSILESQSSDAEEVPSVLRASRALSHMSSNIRVAAAQVCSSALTYVLADGFCHTLIVAGVPQPLDDRSGYQRQHPEDPGTRQSL